MKVIRLCPEFYLGNQLNRGLSMNVLYLMISLEKLGVKHYILTPKTNVKSYKSEDIRIIPSRNLFTIFYQGIDSYKIIKNEFKKEDYDLIHTHNPGFFNLYRYKEELKKPMIHSIHGSPFDIFYQPIRTKTRFKEMLYSYYFTKYAAKRADAVIVMSNNYKRDLIKHFKINESKIHFIPPQVDSSIFKPKKCRKDIDLLYTGRFVTLKNVPFIVKVIKILKERIPGIKVLLIGGTPQDNEYAEVVSLIKEYNLEKNIKIMPPIEHKKLVDYYNRTKVFIFLALSHGVGKSIIEAMACGMPFVTNMAPAEGEASFTNKEGFANLPLNEKKFAEKIELLLTDKSLRKKLGRMAIKKIERFYTAEITGKKTFELYKSLLK